MIVKIRTKGKATGYDDNNAYFQVVGDTLYLIQEDELSDALVFKSVYENPFIEVYYLVGY